MIEKRLCPVTSAFIGFVVLFAFVTMPVATQSGESAGSSDLDESWTVKVHPGTPAGILQTSFRFPVEVPPVKPSAAGEKVTGRPPYDEESPILTAPPARDGDRSAGEKEAAGQKSSKKKPSKARSGRPVPPPMAEESASRDARREWQRKQGVASKSSKAAQAKEAESRNRTAAAKTTAPKSRSKASSDSQTANAGRRGAVSAATRTADAPAVRQNANETESKRPIEVIIRASDNHDPVKLARNYWTVYRSIPFSRAEYDANPSYRHQATMELLLGELRPVIAAPSTASSSRRQSTSKAATLRYLPIIRAGYRSWSRYPWH